MNVAEDVLGGGRGLKESVKKRVKERRPVGLPAMGNKRHGVQGSTPVSEGCDRYHPLLLP